MKILPILNMLIANIMNKILTNDINELQLESPILKLEKSIIKNNI